MLDRFDEAAVLFAFFSSVVFAAGYTLLAPWWRYAAGRAMVSLDFGLTVALLPAVLHYLAGLSLMHAFFAWYYGGSLILVGLIALWRLRVVWRLQTQGAAGSHALPLDPGRTDVRDGT